MTSKRRVGNRSEIIERLTRSGMVYEKQHLIIHTIYRLVYEKGDYLILVDTTEGFGSAEVYKQAKGRGWNGNSEYVKLSDNDIYILYAGLSTEALLKDY